MYKLDKWLMFAAMSVCAFHAHSAGFDCAKASNPIEKMICADTQLSQLDSLLTVAYKKALSNTSTASDLKTEQQYWLQEVRNSCKDRACLTQVYSNRIAQLNVGGLSGEYQRDSEPHTATISIQPVEYQQFHVTGSAVWVGNAETGNVNIGELDGLVELNNNQLNYHSGDDEYACKLIITFVKNTLIVSDDNGYCGGHNVTFNGEYHKKTH